ncbi:TIGR03620 family F420-dependent LLM class oxidoreductase [Compostimonas suwonensis]|nr:TIGR03620 family F420-dependent LLM class oxidoreductase [Compostimonas suwonensis]
MSEITITALREQLGSVGVWSSKIGGASATAERAAAAEIESLGFRTLWFGEAADNKEAFVNASILLQATSSLTVATGIANIYARDPLAAELGANALGEAYGGRFVLGLGVSHAPMVASRGHDYAAPVRTMREYLDAMDSVSYTPPAPGFAVPRVLAALRPRMLELARDRTAGAHPYFVPVEHTERARAILGPDRLLAPELMVVLETDAARARAVARETTTRYLAMPNYANNLRELGYTEEDLAGGGSDRLVDDIVVWGDAAAIRERVDAHLRAGADHVAVQPLAADLESQLGQLRALAPVLLAR